MTRAARVNEKKPFNTGDLVCFDCDKYWGDKNAPLGIVIVSKEDEYFFVRWLDDGHEICYSYENTEFMGQFRIVSRASG